MDGKTIIEITERFAKDKLAGEGTGHDWWHVARVINSAQRIHTVEGGDWTIIHLALLLHDVGDKKVIRKKEDDYLIAQDFLESHNTANNITQRVVSIIKSMSFSNSFDNTEKDDSIELRIVQDADRLDAVGAIGIARAFAFGGSRSRPLYDPDYKTQEFASKDDYLKTQSTDGSTYHHFYEKLLLLKAKMNTETGRSIATQRDAFMRTFLKEFIDEWEGNN